MITNFNEFRKKINESKSKSINENSNILLDQINRLDKFFLHNCKDQNLMMSWEDVTANFLAQFSTPHWASAVKEDESSVHSLLDEWLPKASELGFNLAAAPMTNENHLVFPIQQAIEALMKTNEDISNDCKKALENLAEFIELCGPKALEITKNTNELTNAISGYAKCGDPLEYLGENMTNEAVNKNEIQKALDIFTAQNKMPNIKITKVLPSEVRGVSTAFDENELGLFKNSVESAQIQMTLTMLHNESVCSGHFEIVYKTHGGDVNKMFYYLPSGSIGSFKYSVPENKFSINEKKNTGYNTKRVK